MNAFQSQRRQRRRHDNLLLIAAREPAPGATKTRLGATIGMDAAAHLYRAFLTDLAHRFTPSAAASLGYDLGWAFTPTGCNFAEIIRRLAGGRTTDGTHFVPQVGNDWGERQANLLRWGHDQGYARTVLIASDSPQISVTIPVAAFAALDRAQVALGRVHDGGYYLIGLRGCHDVLTGVPMSTTRAADALRARARALDLNVVELPPTFDVDVEADLDLLVAALHHDPARAPMTWTTLQALGLDQRQITSNRVA